MVKKIQVTGAADNDGAITLVLNGNTLEVKTGETLTAKSLYEFLCFERGSEYDVERVGNGKVKKDVYEAFCKLIEEIAEKLSAIEVEEIDEGKDAKQDASDNRTETHE